MKLIFTVFMQRAALVLPAMLALGGCMTTTPVWDAHFGEAVRAVKQAQIIDPNAAEHAQSASGVDGKSANAAMNTYDRSFYQPVVTPNPFVIGVGNGSSGGQ
ncbi:hypothetical protein P5W98_03715 [Paraburkholderia sp. A1BS-2L]|uniref:hypothetical protein n=1 Tax=unclassified Paraburkholderia TaxID=2615204 RepID=UPI003B7A054B